MAEKYIKVEDLQKYCDNQTDHTISPNEFQRMNHYKFGWHTGKPTEEGWYLCERKKYEYRKYFVYRFKNGKWDYFLPENILRWQKIE